MYFVYMIKNPNNLLYIGITENPEKRTEYHNNRRGAHFTSTALGTSTNKHNFEIVFLEKHQTLAEARQREIQIKKWRREKKEMLINRYKQRLETKYPYS